MSLSAVADGCQCRLSLSLSAVNVCCHCLTFRYHNTRGVVPVLKFGPSVASEVAGFLVFSSYTDDWLF